MELGYNATGNIHLVISKILKSLEFRNVLKK